MTKKWHQKTTDTWGERAPKCVTFLPILGGFKNDQKMTPQIDVNLRGTRPQNVPIFRPFWAEHMTKNDTKKRRILEGNVPQNVLLFADFGRLQKWPKNDTVNRRILKGNVFPKCARFLLIFDRRSKTARARRARRARARRRSFWRVFKKRGKSPKSEKMPRSNISKRCQFSRAFFWRIFDAFFDHFLNLSKSTKK